MRIEMLFIGIIPFIVYLYLLALRADPTGHAEILPREKGTSRDADGAGHDGRVRRGVDALRALRPRGPSREWVGGSGRVGGRRVAGYASRGPARRLRQDLDLCQPAPLRVAQQTGKKTIN